MMPGYIRLMKTPAAGVKSHRPQAVKENKRLDKFRKP